MQVRMNKENMIPTRVAYGKALEELGAKKSNVVVFEADISKSTQTHFFAKAFPDRFFNIGVAEQNEMATAAGAATCGKIPFVSTYSVFASMRACEQMRTSIAYPCLNVKIAVSHGGLTAYDDGVTHQAIEDIGIVRTIPNMTVIQTCDPASTRKAVFAAAEMDGPVYLRFMRIGMPFIYDDDVDFQIGKAITLRKGKDATIFAIGDMVFQSLDAADMLAKEGIDVEVLDMHTIKPADKEAILDSVSKTGCVVTAEDHTILNGLSAAVAEVLVEHCPVPMQRIGLRDTFAESAAYEDLLEHYGMNATHIAGAVKKVIEKKMETNN